ncbi:MAG TPA: type 1 glutamine amidotransferase [Longimicrobiales bacterium]|nr:type 1 glutamine amidotransferase [Longimicrobiales bacterium]
MAPIDGTPRFLLLQVRDADDPMREQEVRCFARSFRCDPGCIEVHDLLSGAPPGEALERADVVLLGGSGAYSVVRGGPWLEPALDTMRWLASQAKPTFASCWGFQAMARALGGEVVTDRARAEVGTTSLTLTSEGEKDPVFAPLGRRFDVIIGHEDVVTRLPPGAVLLASSGLVENEAFRLEGKPIYCTQFHPELCRDDVLGRIAAYPEYLALTSASTIDELATSVPETPHAEELLRRFLDLVARNAAGSLSPREAS